MPAKVAVNIDQITVNDGSSFLVTARDGSIDDQLPQGFFVRDTRLISYYEISLNRTPLKLLASSPLTHRVALYQFTNPELNTVKGTLPEGKLVLTLRRDVVGGLHEDIHITNYNGSPVQFQLMLALRSDFADIFQVKSKELLARGKTQTEWADHKLSTTYQNESFQRGIITDIGHADSEPYFANGRLIFDIVLDPGKTWGSCINHVALADGDVLQPRHTSADLEVTEAGKVLANFLDVSTQLHADNRDVTGIYQQALMDMGALRLAFEDNGETYWMPAAGLPWFMAVFGRDSIIAGLQTMAVNPEFARGTLIRLAQLQATEIDDWRDAQPGKILHEIRRGELAQLHEVPHTPYYGTIEATILWITTLSEAYGWNGDLKMLKDCEQALEQALNWIDQYGDFDGDGYVEYLTHSKDGLRNQGWKDSGDSMIYPDGSQVEPPIALCEVQGYLYDAWKRAASIYSLWDNLERAQALNQKADDLYQRFNTDFWMEEEGFYCFGLDPHKKQIRSITSNPGHLLWSGIVPPERAERVAKRLLQSDMWCGWGVRTLSAQNPAYNPISYQLGSVWPHDNSFIAAGLKRYGFYKEANQVAEGIFTAAGYFEAGRLPELFAGIERQKEGFPVPYGDANVPQAWAAGSIFFLIRTMLGLQADAAGQKLWVNPTLPDWLSNLTLTHLSVGPAKVDLRFWQDQGQTQWEILQQSGELTVSKSSSPNL